MRDRLPLFVVLAATAALFAPCLGYGWAYDDFAVIVDNPTLTEPDVWTRAFTTNVWAFAPELAEARYYRPLFTVWLALQHRLFGVEPMGWHATTLALHLCAVGVLWHLVRKLSGSALAATAAAALFALHPTRGESVAWVSGLTDPMAATVGFGAVLAWVHDRKGTATALFVAALLTKETAIVFAAFPALLAAGERRWRDSARAAAAWGVPAVLFLGVRRAVLGGGAEALGEPADVATLASLLGGYTRHLLAPGELSITYPVEPAWAWAAFGITALGAATALGGRARPLLWMGMLFLLPVLRVSALQPDMMLQDRYLYLPSACWFGAAGWGLATLHDRKPGLRLPALAVAIGLVSSGLLSWNLPAWKSNRALWERATSVHPASGRAWFNLGVDYENAGELDEAERCYSEAVQREPDRALFHFRLAFMYAERKALRPAWQHFSYAADLRSTDPMMLYEAGRIEAFRGDLETAERHLAAARAAVEAGATPGGGVTRGRIEHELEQVRRRTAADEQPAIRWE